MDKNLQRNWLRERDRETDRQTDRLVRGQMGRQDCSQTVRQEGDRQAA